MVTDEVVSLIARYVEKLVVPEGDDSLFILDGKAAVHGFHKSSKIKLLSFKVILCFPPFPDLFPESLTKLSEGLRIPG